jgi:hypothetical protein
VIVKRRAKKDQPKTNKSDDVGGGGNDNDVRNLSISARGTLESQDHRNHVISEEIKITKQMTRESPQNVKKQREGSGIRLRHKTSSSETVTKQKDEHGGAKRESHRDTGRQLDNAAKNSLENDDSNRNSGPSQQTGSTEDSEPARRSESSQGPNSSLAAFHDYIEDSSNVQNDQRPDKCNIGTN